MNMQHILFCLRTSISEQDFAAAGHQWTKALCGKDSDGDGRSNGEELGDPTCTWTSGAPAPQAATGHPGKTHTLPVSYSFFMPF